MFYPRSERLNTGRWAARSLKAGSPIVYYWWRGQGFWRMPQARMQADVDPSSNTEGSHPRLEARQSARMMARQVVLEQATSEVHAFLWR
jgi:hypothetical protein